MAVREREENVSVWNFGDIAELSDEEKRKAENSNSDTFE